MKNKKKNQDKILTNNIIDLNFNNFVNFIEQHSLEKLQNAIKHNFNYMKTNDKYNYKSITDYYNQAGLWGTINLENEDYTLINNNAKTLLENLGDIKWLYEKLGDYRSKKILLHILHYFLMLDYKKIAELEDKTYPQYFDLDLINCNESEVFVDIGAYIGDTLVSYIKTFGKENYKKIYCYEIVPANIEFLEKNIDIFKLENVIVKKYGVSDKKGKLYLTGNEVSSINKLSDEGDMEIDTVTIDDDIQDRVTFIKMDIEGGEEKALLGCRKTILKHHPKIAISAYHNNDHLWKLARIIDEIDPTYKFYFRYYGGPMLPTEYILYAI